MALNHYPAVAEKRGQVRCACEGLVPRRLRRYRFTGILLTLIDCPACVRTLERIGRSIHRAHVPRRKEA